MTEQASERYWITGAGAIYDHELGRMLTPVEIASALDDLESRLAVAEELAEALERIASADGGAYTQNYQPQADELAEVARKALSRWQGVTK